MAHILSGPRSAVIDRPGEFLGLVKARESGVKAP